MSTHVPAFDDADELPPHTSLLGGRLVIDVRIGGGGAATVYAATTADGRDVAVKIMSTAHAELSTSRQRFRNEVMLAQQLAGHPGVVVPYELGELPELGGRPYIAMPLCKGAPLLLEAGRLELVKAVTVLRDLSRILADVHQHGIVHRDVKPSNVLVREQQDGALVPYLIDFGLATSTGEGTAPVTAGLTAVHELPGTKHYMAPEQILGARLDPRFDVYALGVTMVEVLTGILPLHELSPTEAARRKCDPSLPSLSIAGKVPGLPEELERVVDGALEREPERRTESAARVADALDGVIEVLRLRPEAKVERPEAEVEVQEAEVERPERTLTQVIPLHAVAAETVATRSSVEIPVVQAPAPVEAPQRTRRAAAWVVGAAVVLAAGVGAALVVRDGDDSRVEETAERQASSAAAAGAGVLGVGVDAVEEPVVRADVGTTDGDERGDEGEACPKVEPEPEPTPLRRRDEPRKVKKPRPPATSPEVEPPCTDVDAEATTAVRNKQWSRVLKLTKATRCWDDDVTRNSLRVNALFELERYAECVELGETVAHPEVRRWAKRCEQQLQENDPT